MTFQPADSSAPLTVAQLRALDRYAIEQLGIPGIVLMENAARGVAEFVHATLPNPDRDRVVILCGPGNNGGDGFAAARHLRCAGVAVTCILAAPREKVRGDAAINLSIVERMGVTLIPAGDAVIPAAAREHVAGADLIVDALLGTGSSGPPRGVLAELIRLSNATVRARRVAVDVPTGLAADSGDAFEPCFRADATVTLAAWKIGFFTPAAREVLGRVVVASIGIPPWLFP